MPHPSEIWTWENCSNKIRKLSGKNGFPEGDQLSFLGFELDLKTGQLKDQLSGKTLTTGTRTYQSVTSTAFYLLSAYSEATDTQPTGNHISSKQFRGNKFTQRGYTGETTRLISYFASTPENLIKAAVTLGGKEVDFPTGDVAVEFPVLPRVPVIVVFGLPDEEFPAEAWIYFDETIESYFDSEQTYFLTRLMVRRILDALK
jgi:hypothetical protein